MRWFRFYDDALNDPKVQKLPGEQFKAWVNLLCLASKHDKHGGKLPSIEDAAFILRLPVAKHEAQLKAMIKAGLIDEVMDPATGELFLRPHNWEVRQYKSDVSSNRVRAFRQRKRNGDETVDETFHETEETVSETATKRRVKQDQRQRQIQKQIQSRVPSQEKQLAEEVVVEGRARA